MNSACQLTFLSDIPQIRSLRAHLASLWLRAQGRAVALASRLVRPIPRQKSLIFPSSGRNSGGVFARRRDNRPLHASDRGRSSSAISYRTVLRMFGRLGKIALKGWIYAPTIPFRATSPAGPFLKQMRSTSRRDLPRQ